MVDQFGRAIVFKNNQPRYIVLDFALADSAEFAADDDVPASSDKIMERFDRAFQALAK